MNRAVFLDRDGTLIEDKDYLRHPDEVVILPGAGPALTRLQAQVSGCSLSPINQESDEDFSQSLTSRRSMPISIRNLAGSVSVSRKSMLRLRRLAPPAAGANHRRNSCSMRATN